MAGNIANDLLDQLVARLQAQYPVSVDRGAMQQALSF
jgi:peptidyl-prolyl cis-trans isomerase D